MSEKKTASKSRAAKTQEIKVPSKKEKGIVTTVRPTFVLVQKKDGSAIKLHGISAKVGDEIEI